MTNRQYQRAIEQIYIHCKQAMFPMGFAVYLLQHSDLKVGIYQYSKLHFSLYLHADKICCKGWRKNMSQMQRWFLASCDRKEWKRFLDTDVAITQLLFMGSMGGLRWCKNDSTTWCFACLHRTNLIRDLHRWRSRQSLPPTSVGVHFHKDFEVIGWCKYSHLQLKHITSSVHSTWTDVNKGTETK